MPAPDLAGTLVSGTAVTVRAAVDLAGLAPTDVRVEVVIGRVDSNGHLEETEVIVLPFVEQRGTVRQCSPKISFRNVPDGWATHCASARITSTIPSPGRAPA